MYFHHMLQTRELGGETGHDCIGQDNKFALNFAVDSNTRILNMR